ncbi:MAG: TAT-variant-translocated molybdopterin oxidoreductase [Verrucomicrobiota bacterium]|nr:TAT-variant-translocated molybdopterin oxidoreductase [Verrucomicrobiota bacterium]
MKTIPPTCPEPETGPRYWRSLDHLAESPEFQQWVQREFPAGASEFTDPVSRRHFVKIMSASFLLGGLGLTGCRKPEETIIPFSKLPEDYIHGVPRFYATAMPTRTGAIPLLVKSHEGRPIKIEGNQDHPDENGGTDHYAQASILNLYDPDRATRYTKGGNSVSREIAVDHLGEISRGLATTGGRGFAILADRSTSASRLRLQNLIAQKFPQSKWFSYEAIDFDVHRQAATIAFGQPSRPVEHFEKAAVILSLDSDFIGSEEESYKHCRGFAQGRRIEKPTDALNRLYVVEPVMTLTGSNADHRLRRPASGIAQVAAQFAAAIIDKQNVEEKWIAECAKDLLANQGKALVVAGYRQPLEVHLLAAAMNNALGSYGKTISLMPAPPTKEGTLQDLALDLNAGAVETLIILGGNPAYSAPADLNWPDIQKKAREVIHLSYYEDETAAISTWHLPAAHYLESWGDAITSSGTLVPVQPLIAPIFNGITDIEVLARIAGLNDTNPHSVVRETFKIMAGEGNLDNQWKKFLHDGFLAGNSAKPITATFNNAVVGQARQKIQAAPAPGKEQLEVVFCRDYSVDDGRYINNGWLQELPDPITKLVWDNAICISPKTARELELNHNALPENGKFHNDKVEIEVGGRKVQGGVWILPGMADYTIAVSLGYGRTKTGRVGKGTGFNAYALRTSGSPGWSSGAKLRRTGETYHLVTTQEHGMMEGRPIIREGNLEQYRKKPDFAKNMDLEAHAPNAGPIYKHPYREQPSLKSDVHQWGMVIDLNTCVGCNACVVACQSENNIPIVGKEQVSKGREMHWLRIDRYFSSSPGAHGGNATAAEDPQVNNQPMLCQHCESAPCESVCPVNATVHDEEGLNLMAYNRCVGTRYCSNNCPYKVRRFNFFDYNRRPLDKLTDSPLQSPSELMRWFKKPEEGSIPQDEWELKKLVKNPDVTVRMRGVMEKCTFCVQRIEGAKIAQKVKAGASGNVRVPEGTFTTACAQACPAGAIVFGNLADPDSAVNKLKAQPRNYSVLGFLDTKPRLTYLARIRNPNPAMPDYYDMPLSLKEYSDHHGNPMDTHASPDRDHAHGTEVKAEQKGGH